MLKIGTKVKIRPDLKPYQWYGKNTFAEEMEWAKGKVCTISGIAHNQYFLKEDLGRFLWTEEMFELNAHFICLK